MKFFGSFGVDSGASRNTESKDDFHRIGDDHLNILQEQYSAAFRELDRTLISISTGLLAASVALATSENFKPLISDTDLLKFSWALFTLTIISLLASFKAEQNHKRHLIESRNYKDKCAKEWRRKLKAANNIALGSFILGLLVVVFALLSST